VRITDLPTLPPRPRDGHKGTFGRVLVLAGSRGMSGAAVLCGLGALRGGAGLVQVATPAAVQPVVAAGNLCYLTAALPDTPDGHLAADAEEEVLDLAAQATAVAVGPGLGQSRDVTALVRAVLTHVSKPIVLDADGLNALSRLLTSEPELHVAGPLVCTPHSGEFARLLCLSPDVIRHDRESPAVRFARDRGAVLVLKGNATLVTDGERLYENTTGNPGMATGGTGDVLTGLIAALLAQGLAPFDASRLGVYLHGLAGDIAARDVGEVSLIASDLADYLPLAFQQHLRSV
jgi:NAD(P)H-hydrate epimerase